MLLSKLNNNKKETTVCLNRGRLQCDDATSQENLEANESYWIASKKLHREHIPVNILILDF